MNRRLQLLFLLLPLLSFTGSTDVLKNIMGARPSLHRIMDQQLNYQVQVIYTQIDRDANNVPSFKQHTYYLDAKTYYYAASLVKLPCSALALEKLEALKIDKEFPMLTDSACACQKRVVTDTSSADGDPSMAHYIKRMLLVSDNDAYSRTYEFLGQKYIHDKLTEKGYPNAYIIHRFDAGCNTKNNACTNPVDFYDASGKLFYHQDAATNKETYRHPLGEVKAGKGYKDAGNKLVMQPKDFSNSNYISLQDINDMLKSIVFPEEVPASKRFQISEENRQFLLKYLSMLPRESARPRYSSRTFYDSYKKYLLYGDSKKKIGGDSLRIFNMVGQSYGFMADVAYVCDFKNKVEFMLSAVIYTNADGIINDGKYEYETVALPFFGELGRAVYAYDKKRKRAVVPDLSAFRFSY